MKITKSKLALFAKLANSSQYNMDLKKEFKSLGKAILTELANELNLADGTYEIRFNPGGIAISGDNILHADTFYVNMSDNCGAGWFYYRSCKGKQDYSGGNNHCVEWRDFIKMGIQGLADEIRLLK